MSRTFRRSMASFRRRRYFTFDEFEACYFESPWLLERNSNLPAEKAFKKEQARFFSDHRSGYYNAPRFFRRLYGSRYFRNNEKKLMSYAAQNDSWDNMPYPKFPRNAGWYWF